MTDTIGTLRHRVEIWRSTTAETAMGKRVGVPALLATVWASVRPDRGTTAQEGQVPVDRCDLIITFRNLGEVRTLSIDDRLKFEGDTYRMLSIEPGNPNTGRRTVYVKREAPGRLPSA
jgi:head-tail adaptor